MITDKETNTVYFSEILRSDKRFSKTCKEIINILEICQVDYSFLPYTRDIWARDYMPIQVTESKFVEYRYDPDYLQGEENRMYKTYPDIVCDSIGLKTIKTDIIIDGGNIIKSKNSVLLTNKVFIENKGNYLSSQLIEKLKQLFEVERIIIIPWDEKNDIFGHADGMIRFINENKVLLQGYFDTYSKKFKDKLFNALKDNGIEWTKLEFSVEKEDEL
jgi:agmatine deiminase